MTCRLEAFKSFSSNVVPETSPPYEHIPIMIALIDLPMYLAYRLYFTISYRVCVDQ